MFGIIIWGSRGRSTTLAVGQFYCPQCHAQRTYQHKRLSKYFTLYFIPLFPTQKLAEYVECDNCHTNFKLEVLESSGQTRIPEFIRGLSTQLQAGQSAQSLINGLLGAGFSQADAARVVYSAANGQLVVCNDCQFIYSGALAFCSNCGGALVPFRPKS